MFNHFYLEGLKQFKDFAQVIAYLAKTINKPADFPKLSQATKGNFYFPTSITSRFVIAATTNSTCSSITRSPRPAPDFRNRFTKTSQTIAEHFNTYSSYNPGANTKPEAALISIKPALFTAAH